MNRKVKLYCRKKERTGLTLHPYILLTVIFRDRCRMLDQGLWDKVVPCRGSEGILPHKILKIIEVVGNGISSILRPSESIMMSHYFNLGGSTEPLLTLLDPSQIFTDSLFTYNWILQTNNEGVCRVSWEKLEYMVSFEIKENEFHLCTWNSTPQKKLL